MSWKRHVAAVPQGAKLKAAIEKLHSNLDSQITGGSTNKFASYLPEVYAGQPNRVERYGQFENMDRDPEVAGSVDTIADFGTQTEEQEETMFNLVLKKDATDAEVEILNTALEKWTKLNKFKQILWRMFRSTIMYGDQFFVRDPETFEWQWVNHEKVESIIVNEADGKKPDQYVIKDMDLNIQTLVATLPTKNPNRGFSGWAGTSKNAGPVSGVNSIGTPAGTNRFEVGQYSSVVDAEHVIHLSMTEGLDANWPFGNSILESIFKPFKQKELLEDAIIIYRVQRAPERRVFYIDVGNAPPHKAMEFVNRIKNEIHQRRIPTQNGGGTSMMDAAYNPLSIIEDYFFPNNCLSLNTEIPLLDGRTLPLGFIIDEYKEGKKNFVYGMNNKTFELEPAEIKWAGITRKNAEVCRITLDNNETITLTPDHRVITREGKEIEAKDLKIGESLMPLELREGYSGPKQKNKKYTRYRSNNTGGIKFVHAVISDKPVGKDTQVHHIDFNSKNNNPDNLQVLTTGDHIELHKKIGTYSLQKQWNNPKSRQKIIDGMRSLYDNSSEEFKEKLSERNRQNTLNAWKNKSKEDKQIHIKRITKESRKYSKKRKIHFDIAMFDAMKEAFDDGHNSISKICVFLKTNDKFQKAYHTANKDIIRKSDITVGISPSDTTLNKIVSIIGFKTFGDWKEDYTGIPKFSNKQNHKVISIEFLTEREDTGDITIESKSNSHWFGLSAGIYVHNSEGRGSKVETLPGGDNLGEIDDLKYFNNKLLRGLRVPSSYLPYGPEDGSQSYNDGRVGTAYMQEFRFAKYVKRLQNLVNPIFDREFKIFLRHRGVNIDAGTFDVQLHEPQNFSKYRQMEIDSAQIGVWQPLSEVPYMSKRYVMSRYLNMTEEEILENERMWKEENPDLVQTATSGAIGSAPGGGLSAVGVTPEENDDFDAGEIGDESGMEEDTGEDSPISGTEEAPVEDLEL